MLMHELRQWLHDPMTYAIGFALFAYVTALLHDRSMRNTPPPPQDEETDE